MRLHEQRDALTREVNALREGMRALMSYLMSEKFHTDTTVQTSDVMMRLMEVSAAGHDANLYGEETEETP